MYTMYLLRENLDAQTSLLENNEKCLLLDQTLTLGRNPDCSVVFPMDDRFVSRVHATVELMKTSGQDDTESEFIVRLTDQSSFGTVVNQRRLTKGESVVLKLGDLIKFGNSIYFTLRHEELIVAHTHLDTTTRDRLERAVEMLTGTVSPVLTQKCTHLCTRNLSFTPKTCQALIYGLRFATVDFFEKLVAWIVNPKLETRPVVSDYAPACTEEQLTDVKYSLIEPNPERREIFNGKIFYCFCKRQQFQKDKFGQIVEWGGGKLVVLSREADDRRAKEVLLKSGRAVLLKTAKVDFDPMSREDQAWISDIVIDWRSRGLREISEKEIPFAILSASIMLYCNPKVSKDDLCLEQSMQSQAQEITASQFFAVSGPQQPIPNVGQASKRDYSTSNRVPSESGGQTEFLRPLSPKRRKVSDQSVQAVVEKPSASSMVVEDSAAVERKKRKAPSGSVSEESVKREHISQSAQDPAQNLPGTSAKSGLDGGRGGAKWKVPDWLIRFSQDEREERERLGMDVTVSDNGVDKTEKLPYVFVPLRRKSPERIQPITDSCTDLPNYKKFKKAKQGIFGVGGLPKIIGNSEMDKYTVQRIGGTQLSLW